MRHKSATVVKKSLIKQYQEFNVKMEWFTFLIQLSSKRQIVPFSNGTVLLLKTR